MPAGQELKLGQSESPCGMNTSSQELVPPMRWFWVFLSIGSMWVLMALGPLTLLVPFVCVFLIVNALQSKRSRPLLAVGLSPMVVLFVSGIMSWFSTRPSFQFFGLPTPEAYNLKSETRCYARSSGCLVDGGEMIRQGPHNLGLTLMCAAFGWPPKTYHGFYPSQEQANKLTEDMVAIPLKDFEEGLLRLPAGQIEVGEHQAHRMLLDANTLPGDGTSNGNISVRAQVFEGDCLAIRVTNDNPDMATDLFYLFDRTTRRAFARYQYGSRSSNPPFFAGNMDEVFTD